jgi:predicted nicotinamide N-methyase
VSSSAFSGSKGIETGILADLTASASPALQASLRERLAAVRPEGVPIPAPLLEARIERTSLGDPRAPVHLVRPANWSALREAEQEAGHATPYWAIPWPSGHALARAVFAQPPARGARVLELGCGLALPSIAAAKAGANVLATDGSPDAAVYAAHNLALNEVEGEVLPGDWRALGDQLGDREWDLVLAADVLYLRENVDSLLRLLTKLMRPGTETWLADPRRSGAEEFLPAAKKLWNLDSVQDEQDDRIMLHRLRPRADRRGADRAARPPAPPPT